MTHATRADRLVSGPALYRSPGAVVVLFIDAGPHKGYAFVFEETKNGDGLLRPDQLERAAAKLGVSADVLCFDGPVTKDAFVTKCKDAIGEDKFTAV